MSRRHFPSLALFIFMALTAVACGRGPAGRAPSDDLAAAFAHPPDSARPWAYWMWMDGNLTREGITADLEAMRAAGLGGVVICEVNVGVPRGPVEFMSPEWRRLFKHVVREAERLGLEITLNAGPGLDGLRRAVGQARAIDAAHRRRRGRDRRPVAVRRGPAPARASSGLLRRGRPAAGAQKDNG